MSRFEGKLALVTGGASGIGLATAQRLAELGAQVWVADIDRANGEAAASKIGGSFLELDVRDPAAWSRAMEQIGAAGGGLDIAFLNAGITTYPPRDGARLETLMASFDIATLSDEDYRRILGVNVDGVVFGARAVVPQMERRGGGAIVATASVAGLIGFAPDPIYTLTKHAVVGLVRALARTLEARHITINGICPAIVDTNILGPGRGQILRQAGLPVMEPSQIADAVVHAIESGTSGEAYVCLAGRPPLLHAFPSVRGVGLPES